VYVGIVSDNSLKLNGFLKIYPIPSTGNIFLNNYSNLLVSIKIFELSGKLVKNSFSVNPFDKYTISLPKGHFIAEIKNRNSLSFQKIIILD
ncbi:MAG: T9SS type A sorting domain-containing protein, partial [Flavobacteriales bacterium]|nr:T9SS type A sorting domain-containing protein [Flavobacteriales bacterium]